MGMGSVVQPMGSRGVGTSGGGFGLETSLSASGDSFGGCPLPAAPDEPPPVQRSPTQVWQSLACAAISIGTANPMGTVLRDIARMNRGPVRQIQFQAKCIDASGRSARHAELAPNEINVSRVVG
jgi:hypothetical protein